MKIKKNTRVKPFDIDKELAKIGYRRVGNKIKKDNTYRLNLQRLRELLRESWFFKEEFTTLETMIEINSLDLERFVRSAILNEMKRFEKCRDKIARRSQFYI